MADIGTTLREARIRARIDISEVEARTKIRAKYLRAIENEEWDLLPGPVYVKSFLQAPQVFADDAESQEGEFDPDEDPLLDRAIEIVVTAQTASVSLLQRRLRVGYTRAGRLIDMLERRGIISAYEGSKPRRVLITEHDLERTTTTIE